MILLKSVKMCVIRDCLIDECRYGWQLMLNEARNLADANREG